MSMVTYLSNRLAETKAELAAERAKVARLREALRLFVGATHPVHKAINQRGHVWVETYLDSALKNAHAALKDADG